MPSGISGTWVSRSLAVALVVLGCGLLGTGLLGGGLLGCGDGSVGDGGDAGSLLDVIVAEERAACAHLFELGRDVCPVVAADEEECVAGLARIRVESAEPDCLPEHRAFVACIAALTECTGESGTLCPTEYSALGLCAR